MEESYTNTVLQAISIALNEGINDVTKVTLTIAAIVILIIIIAVVLRFRNRKRIIKSAEASFQKLIRKFNLTILELDLIEKLANTLKKPEEKYILLVKISRFRQAEHRAGELSDAEKEISAQLKIKLGFTDSDINEGEITTKSFVRGMPAKIAGSSDELSNAEVYSVSETNLTVKFSSNIPVIPDNPIRLFAVSEGRLRVFSLLPDKVRGELFSAAHTRPEEDIKQKIKIRIFFESEDPENIINRKSMIVMFSKQGAVITDQKNELQQGNRLKLYLDNDKKKKYPVEAEVIQISEEKGLASIKYANNE